MEITLEQSQFLSDGGSNGDSPVWSIPLLFSTSNSTSTEAVIMDQKVQTFAIPLIKDSGDSNWIKINSSQKALIRVAHSGEMVVRLKKAITDNALSAVDRSALLLDSYALAEAGLAPLETVVEILRALENETNSTVWGAISATLKNLQRLLEQIGNAQTLANFNAFGKRVVTKGLCRVGWDSKVGETHTDKLMRASIMVRPTALLPTYTNYWSTVVVLLPARLTLINSLSSLVAIGARGHIFLE